MNELSLKVSTKSSIFIQYETFYFSFKFNELVRQVSMQMMHTAIDISQFANMAKSIKLRYKKYTDITTVDRKVLNLKSNFSKFLINKNFYRDSLEHFFDYLPIYELHRKHRKY